MSGIRKVEKPLIFAVFNSPLVFFTIFSFQAAVCTAHDSRLFFVTRLHWTCLIRLLVATDS